MMPLYGGALGVLALAGMPLFAVMCTIAMLGFQGSGKEVWNIAANVYGDMFNSTILVTIPLFTLVGYLMAESKAPERMVRAANALLGWLPGGLAIVAIFASAFFTTLTGGSGVTIVAIGGLLYPALIRQGYPAKFALGLVTSAGAIGLLLPPSPLVLIYSFVSGVELQRAYLATLPPGLLLMLVLCGYAMVSAKRFGVKTQKFNWRDVGPALWEVKWEALTPFLVLTFLATGLTALHESAAAGAAYTLLIEVYVYRDLTWKKVLKVSKDAMTLCGAIILILAMATALNNYIIDATIPQRILEFFEEKGINSMWQFVLVVNVLLFIVGMAMDAFSALLVVLPLLVPMAARFGVSPFYLAVMFLLQMEVAYISPPVGLNLYVASFRFKRPLVEVYRVILPFLALLAAGLVALILVPKLSTFTVDGSIATFRLRSGCPGVKPDDPCRPVSVCLRAKKLPADECARLGPPGQCDEASACPPEVAPREAWLLECAQEDRNHPKPCHADDIKDWGREGLGITPGEEEPGGEATAGGEPRPSGKSAEEEKMLNAFLDDEEPAKSATPATSSAPSAAPAPSASGKAEIEW
ncbi:MAG: TRAP transporter large permease subunit [Myxococcales bacterium]|nr:TRAP transporter large permease subunit [Myxococcales bacterium]